MTTGYLIQKKGRYYVVINLYDINGKRVQKSHATGLNVKNNKRKALEVLKKICNEYDAKHLNYYSDIRVSDYFRKWLISIKTEVRPNTYRTYKGNMENHIIPYFENINIELQELKPYHLTDFYKTKVDCMSVTTIKHLHQHISKALSDAVERGIITFNPASAAKTPKQVDRFMPEFLNRGQIEKLLTYLQGTPIYLPTFLCTVYGFRRSEVLGLRWHNIDFENETIRITETLQQSTKEISGSTNYMSITKTESSNRTLPMIPSVKELLSKQREIQIGSIGNKNDILNNFVCVFDDGRVITPNYLSKKFHQIIISQSDLPQIRFHDLRHSVASNLLNDGFSMAQVAEWMGHSSPTTTLKFYAHADKSSKMAIANKIGNIQNP